MLHMFRSCPDSQSGTVAPHSRLGSAVHDALGSVERRHGTGEHDRAEPGFLALVVGKAPQSDAGRVQHAGEIDVERLEVGLGELGGVLKPRVEAPDLVDAWRQLSARGEVRWGEALGQAVESRREKGIYTPALGRTMSMLPNALAPASKSATWSSQFVTSHLRDTRTLLT